MRHLGNRKSLVVLVAGTLLAGAAAIAVYLFFRREPLPEQVKPPEQRRHTVESRLEMFGERIDARIGKKFQAQEMPWPFRGEVALLAFKDARRLEVYARAAETGPWRFITSYPILGAGGRLGPKLREGDHQVPEGIYGIEYLNPNSRFHVSAKITFPNEFDWARAREEGRTQPGSDIFIHGKSASIGCLAMGDPASEDLFALIAHAGKEDVTVIIAPTDFRRNSGVADLPEDVPPWTPDLYEEIRNRLKDFPPPAETPS